MGIVKQILCMKWGTMYGPKYVNVLYSMVSRNITGAFNVICLTDDAQGIRPEVTCFPLPELGCDIPERDHKGRMMGKWPKVALWSRELYGLEGVALFVDLDSVIVSNIDDYFSYGNSDDVITARNWVKPLNRIAQTSVMRFPIGKHPYMLDRLRADPVGVSCRYRFEQFYTTYGIEGGVKMWPRRWTKHFGIHCMGPWPLRYLRAPVLPRGVKIVTFPGDPKPPDVIDGWSGAGSNYSRKEYLQWLFSRNNTEKRVLKQVSRYTLPCDWVKEHWRAEQPI